jgi:hypothetical protein
MATSAAANPQAYLAELPPDRRKAVGAVRASQKQHCSLYLTAVSLPLKGIGRLIAAVTPDTLIEQSKRLGR